jgi:multidrug efflux pump subunit AcrA (membrane-fusion protein)
VIGISDYTAGWPRLRGVREDVREVRRALEDNGFSVTLVENPDRAEFERAVREFIVRHGRKPDNRLLFYYAGHGFTQKLGYGGDMGYLVPRDAPDPNRDLMGFELKAISMQNIETYARTIGAKHALFVFDACFAGSIFNVTRAIPKSIELKTAKPVRQFLTSGSADQEVPDKSVFRIEFVRALQGDGALDGDGYMTASELGQYLETKVVEYRGEQQTPQYGKLNDPLLNQGDFVFALRKAAPAPEPPAVVPQAVPQPEERLDVEAWAMLQDSDDPEDLEFFIEQFPDSPRVKLARLKLKMLERKQVKAKVEQQQLAKEAKQLAEERQRLEAEKLQLADAKRKAKEEQKRKLEVERKQQLAKEAKRLEEERKQLEAEKQQLAEAKRKAAEEQKQQLAEEAKQEEERKRQEAEQRRIAEAKHKAEEERKRQEELAAISQKKEKHSDANDSLSGSRITPEKIKDDYLAAGAKNTTQAYRVFIKKYASVPEAESWVSLARKSIKGLAPKTHDAHQANVKRIKPAYHKAVIKQAYDKAVKEDTTEAYERFLQQFKDDPAARFRVRLAIKKLKNLGAKNVNEEIKIQGLRHRFDGHYLVILSPEDRNTKQRQNVGKALMSVKDSKIRVKKISDAELLSGDVELWETLQGSVSGEGIISATMTLDYLFGWFKNETFPLILRGDMNLRSMTSRKHDYNLYYELVFQKD